MLVSLHFYEDDQTNVTTEIPILNATTSGNYLTWSQTFNPILVVNHFYNVELFSDFAFGTQIIVYGKIGMSCGMIRVILKMYSIEIEYSAQIN